MNSEKNGVQTHLAPAEGTTNQSSEEKYKLWVVDSSKQGTQGQSQRASDIGLYQKPSKKSGSPSRST